MEVLYQPDKNVTLRHYMYCTSSTRHLFFENTFLGPCNRLYVIHQIAAPVGRHVYLLHTTTSRTGSTAVGILATATSPVSCPLPLPAPFKVHPLTYDVLLKSTTCISYPHRNVRGRRPSPVPPHPPSDIWHCRTLDEKMKGPPSQNSPLTPLLNHRQRANTSDIALAGRIP